MPNYYNTKSGAVHYANFGSATFLCGTTRTDKFKSSDRPLACKACQRTLEPRTKHHITGSDNPIFDLAQEIGEDLPDGAFWALYNELSG